MVKYINEIVIFSKILIKLIIYNILFIKFKYIKILREIYEKKIISMYCNYYKQNLNI